MPTPELARLARAQINNSDPVGFQLWQQLKDNPIPVYQWWWRWWLPPPEVFSDLDLSKLICIFIGANSLQELKDRDDSCYYYVLKKFCRISGYDMANIIFYPKWTAMRDGEVSRERDTDAVYLPFVDGHARSANWWVLTPAKESEISEGHGESDFRPTRERLAYLEELDREILLVILPICWSKEAADVLLDGVVKHVFPQDNFPLGAYDMEFKHKMESLVLYFEKAWPSNDTRIEDRLSVPTDCGTKYHSGFHPSHPARIHSD